MKSLQVIIEGVETPVIEQLDDKQAEFLIGQWLSVGFMKKLNENKSEFYPAARIQKIVIEESSVILPK